MMQMWREINETFDLGFEIIYSAEEPGCELYWTNDPCEVGKYILDVWDSDAVGFESDWDAEEKYVVKILQKMFNVTENDIDILLDIFEESKYRDSMSIHKWKYVPINEVEICFY